MSVHKKLMEARIRLQNTKLQKTGHNKFAGYTYFELGDFLPTVQQIFSELGLCGTISFTSTEAQLQIVDTEDVKVVINFLCPMAMASLKGCHEVQNLGASMTYIRRYLWVNALEIVEHDVLDATTGKDVPKSSKAVTTDVWDNLEPEKQRELQEVVDGVRFHLDNNDMSLAVELLETIKETDDKVAAWSRFDSKERAAIKKYQAERSKK